MKVIEPGDVCENEGCSHPATTIWTGDGGLALSRDYMQQKWCECCVLKVQLDHALEMVSRIKDLYAQLLKACVKNG